MSGIYGFTYRAADSRTVRDAIGGLQFWNRIYGSDGCDQKVMNTTGFGCCLEHLSDLVPVSAPILAYRNCPAVVDALIYNRDELFEVLHLDQGEQLSDEQLLLLLIEKKGFRSLHMVNGDFAGAIYDDGKKEWILFRDHLGVRPFYIYFDENLFSFSTDLRALASMPGADMRINEMQLYRKIIGACSLSLQETDFQNIRCPLPAAVTYVQLTDRGIALREDVYWKLRSRKIRLPSDRAYQQELRRLVTDSVSRRCDAISGLLGAELSGGLDSSTIDILINRHGREARYYSWSHPLSVLPLQEGEDERKIILEICAQEGISCRFLESEDRLSDHDAFGPLMPPFTNTMPLSHGSAWVRSQGARVMFTGHAGDEGVSHRGSRHELFCNREYLAYFKIYWNDLAGKRFRLLRAFRAGMLDAMRFKRNDIPASHTGYGHYGVLTQAFSQRMAEQYQPRRVYFNTMPYKYVMQGGTRPRMENAAFQGAFNGVRYLFPYVDYRVMDYAVSVPRRLYFDEKRTRVLFREAFRDIMPNSLYILTSKDSPSTRNHRTLEGYDKFFLTLVERALSLLDRDMWKDILDFDGIAALRAPADPSAPENGILNSLVQELFHCYLIQRIIKEAPNWRETDEQDNPV